MIVQTTSTETRPKVIPMRDHLDLVGQFGLGFGNDEFASLNPKALMEFAIANHDAGWDSVDAALGIDPDTGLPRNLLATPLEDLVKTGPGSADFNEAHHPFCGLLVSMHAYGLLNGRYGLSDKVVVDILPPHAQPMFRAMLDSEVVRQERLKAELAADPRTAEWVAEDTLFHNYKVLQFFDTLGLYFCMEDEGARGESVFLNVPRSVGDDVSVTVTPVETGVYRMSPFPFREDPFVVTLSGTLVVPVGVNDTAQTALACGERTVENVTLVS